MTNWYISPAGGDQFTHQYLVMVIGAQYEEKDKSCVDGRKNFSRDLFKCPNGYSDVKVAINAISAHGLRFEVYKEDVEEEIVRFMAWERRMKRKANLY
ncbi:MAG: hypothetical protein G01um101491_294 [Parcubacteria group bacterium Gr01-1014_91]|nr:MAG: hypothetical protein G01um101491_294 [Parcubacteria group bacterium Gr01-1014_91]